MTRTMRLTAATALWLMILAGFWYATTSTLDDMTRVDCRAGVQRACAALDKAGLKR